MMLAAKRGFTLIELLIVVAIIGILAAIAIPNFLQAQVRAKVARSKAEMGSVGTALEMYHVDHNEYPPPYRHPAAPLHWRYNVPNELTTPIQYLSNAEAFFDPFSLFESMNPADPRYQFHRYGYINVVYTRETHYPFTFTSQFEKSIGAWRLDGYSPARTYGAPWPYAPSYDPTNGTISSGEIYRSQKDAEGVQNL